MEFSTLSILASLALGLAVFADTDAVAFHPIPVPQAIEEKGYSAKVVTGDLINAIRAIHDKADLTLHPMGEDLPRIDSSLQEIEGYFQVTSVVTAVRQALGLVKITFSGEIVEIDNQYELRLHGHRVDGGRVSIVKLGSLDSLPVMIRAAGFDAMQFLHPAVAALYALHHEVKEGSKDFPQTRAVIEAALPTATRIHRYYLQSIWGQALAVSGRLEEALAVFDLAIREIPDRPIAYSLRADVLAHMERYTDAAASFRKAYDLGSGHWVVFGQWAHTLMALGDEEGALNCYRHALRRHPTQVHLYERAGDLLMKMARYDEAATLYRQGWEREITSQVLANKLADAEAKALGALPHPAAPKAVPKPLPKIGPPSSTES